MQDTEITLSGKPKNVSSESDCSN